jgi:hypothetical protein
MDVYAIGLQTWYNLWAIGLALITPSRIANKIPLQMPMIINPDIIYTSMLDNELAI